MASFNYSLYNNPYIFNLNFTGTTSVVDTKIYQYHTSLYNLDSAVLNSSNSQIKEEDFKLLPMAIRYLSDDRNTFIVERPPFRIPIDFSTSKSYRSRKSIRALSNGYVWVPWTLAKITLNPSVSYAISFDLYFNDRSVASLDDTLIACYFPNSSSGNICMGQDTLSSANLSTKSSILEVYNFYFNSYFSGWNSDLSISVDGMSYFTQMKSELINQKGAPANLERFINTNGYGFSNTETHKNFLYLMSTLDLNSTLKFIAHLKDSSQGRRYAGISTLYSVKEIIAKNSSFSLPTEFTYGNRYSFVRTLANSLDSFGQLNDPQGLFRTRTNVHIDNYPFDIEADAHIDNPFVIAQIYKNNMEKFFENSNNEIYDEYSKFNQTVHLDYSIIEPYLVNREAIVHANSN